MYSILGKREIQGIPVQSMVKASTGLYFLQRMKLDRKLCVHNGCVNTICWNEKGTQILSGSDDQHLAITDPFSGKSITKFRSGHRSNIFSAKFMPSSLDKEVVSCSGSGEIFYTDIEREDTYGTNRFDCHFGSTYKLLVVPNEAATFLSCGDDGTVRFFDLRMKTSCSKFSCEEDVLILLRNAVTSMAIDPVIPYQLAVASSDGIVRLYDRRMLKPQNSHAMHESLIFKFPPPMSTNQEGSNGGRQRYYRVTSLNYRPGSHDLLVNYSSENIYLFNTYDIRQQMSYTVNQAATQPSCVVKQNNTACGTSAATSKASGIASSNRGADAPVASTPPSDTGSDSESSSFKPIKRLRLRGDWSDTGPNARPEGEEPAQNIMQRMSDLLTRMLNSHGDQDEDGMSGQESENNDVREEAQEQEQNEAELPRASGPQEPDHQRPVGGEDAAAMLHSVMFGSAQSRPVGVRDERDASRVSISSEGMVSLDLSPQGAESLTEPLLDTGSHRSNADNSAAGTLESSEEGSECSENSQVSGQKCFDLRKEGQDSVALSQLSLGQEKTSLNQFESVENQTPAPSHSQLAVDDESENDDRDSQQANVTNESQEASSSSSERTETTVISAIQRVGDIETNMQQVESNGTLSQTGVEEMEVDSVCLKQGEDSLNENIYVGTKSVGDETEPVSNESSSDSNVSVSDKMAEGLQITPISSCPVEENSSISRTNIDLHLETKCDQISELNSQDTREETQKSLHDSSSLREAEKCSPTVPSDPSYSGPSSDSITVASLWSSSFSATTAIAEDDLEGSNSDQTLKNVSTPCSLSTIASSNEQDTRWGSQSGHILDGPRQQASAAGMDLGISVDLSTSDESNTPLSQDYQMKMSSIPHKPCKSCGKEQTSGRKGKGGGKSISKRNFNNESSKVSDLSQFTSYNIGQMRISSDAPLDSDEDETSGLATARSGAVASACPAPRSSNSGSEQRRRHGHSLPPTGKFQLYGSDDDDDDDEDDDDDGGGGGPDHRKATNNIRSKSDKERMSKAAQKIQEAFRQRREAREFARIKEAPQPKVFMKFSGHRNCRTVIKEANFYGDDYVISGSDCGRIMFWERETGRLVMYLDADKHVVNCVQPNPYAPVLASSGIDYDVKIWCPLEQDTQFDEVKSAEIISRNERMLEVTRDTITVPAAFMLRILASLSQIRNRRNSSRLQQSSEPSSSGQD